MALSLLAPEDTGLGPDSSLGSPWVGWADFEEAEEFSVTLSDPRRQPPLSLPSSVPKSYRH